LVVRAEIDGEDRVSSSVSSFKTRRFHCCAQVGTLGGLAVGVLGGVKSIVGQDWGDVRPERWIATGQAKEEQVRAMHLETLPVQTHAAEKNCTVVHGVLVDKGYLRNAGKSWLGCLFFALSAITQYPPIPRERQ
jgi:hypothetical protein